MALSEEGYNLYNAVYAVAHTYHEIIYQLVESHPMSKLSGVFYDCHQLPTSTCSMTCTPGFRKFHVEQTADCCFDCVWCPENEVSNETDLDQCMSCPEDQHSNIEHTHCLQRHVSTLAYEDPLGMTLACMSLCFSALTVLVLGAFVKNSDTPIVKANNRILSYILLISITLCFLCSLLFIGHPNTVTCILQQTTFGVFFTVAVSTVLAKTLTVVLAFKLTTPGKKMRGILISGAPKFVIPICTMVQLILCGIWLVTSPPFIDKDTHSEHGQIIIVCNKGSAIAFHFVLGYLGCLALGSFTVAFLARNLPDRFNEAKFLTFSMLVFCSVWVTFLPVYHSTKGKVMVAVEVFSILASSAGLLGLTETSCFWRMKHNEEYDEDLRNDCVFCLFLSPDPIEEDFYNSIIDFRFQFTNLESERDRKMASKGSVTNGRCSFVGVGVVLLGKCVTLGFVVVFAPLMAVNYMDRSHMQWQEALVPLGHITQSHIQSKYHYIHFCVNKKVLTLMQTVYNKNDYQVLSRDNKRIPTKKFEFFLVLIFATEEINKNPYLLPNMSLLFCTIRGTCFDTLKEINMLYAPEHVLSYPPNYECGTTQCDVHITGPSRSLSIKMPIFVRCPKIFFGPYNPILSDNVLFHNVYQLAHKDTCLANAMVSLMLYFTWTWMASLLKKRVFTNPIGEVVDMNLRAKLCADYDIYNIWNFPQGLGLKVKIGGYYSYFPQSQQLYISEDLERNMGATLLPNSTCSMICTPGFRKFHEEQRADCCFDCALCPENEVSNETDMEQCVHCPEDQYSNTEHTRCLQRHVSFLAYEEPLGMTLACMSLCFSALTVLVLGAFVKYKDTPIVKANNRILSYILLISITLCFLCSLLFIGHPNTVTCILQQTTFGVFFTVAVSTVLAKTITVVLAFMLTTPGKSMRGMLVSGAPKFVIPICTMVQLILCGIWLVTSPPFIDTDTHSEHGQIIIVCNKGSVIAFHFVLGYLGTLALGSFTVAFMARNLPDRFNEAKFLTFSMLVFCSVWITFLPVYHSTKGK
ncbi:hypothetical protein STEG23_020640, partial [Scotinomys teguina]